MNTFFLILGLLLLSPPLGWAVLLLKRRRRGLPESVGLALLTAALGVWSVFQSQSSTGALGLLPLPLYIWLAALLGWLGGVGRYSPRRWRAALGWLLLSLALAIPVLLLTQGLQTRSLNQERAAQQAAQWEAIARNKAAIQALLARQPGQDSEQLDGLSRQNGQDRAWLFALLEHPAVRADTLERLASTEDSGVLISVLRHPNTGTETLRRVASRNKDKLDYLLADLARNPKTPPELLLELHERPATLTHHDRVFSGNPALPSALQRTLIERSDADPHVIENLLHNPGLDCALLPALRAQLAKPRLTAEAERQRSSQQEQLHKLATSSCAAQPPPTAPLIER